MTDNRDDCSLAVLSAKLDRVLKLSEETHTAIFGNNNQGIKARLCVVESSCKRAWWFFGLCFLAGGGLITALICYV